MRLIVLLFLSVSAALAQVGSIIPSSNRVDWIPGVTVGVFGGIPDRTAIAATLAAGSTAAQINSAISVALSNRVVKLSLGDFNLDDLISLKSGVTLRGSSKTGTRVTLSSSASLRMLGDATLTAASTNLYYSSLAKGVTNISTIVGGPPIAAGNTLLIYQDNDPALVQIFSGATNKMTMDAVRVVSVAGTNVNFWPPMTWNFDAAFHPGYRVLTGPQIEFAGIEDMTIIPDSSIAYPIYMVQAYSCWAKNIIITNIPSNGVYSYGSLMCEGFEVDVLKSQSAGDGYGFNLDTDSETWYGAQRFLIQNSIFDGLYHGVIASANTGSAISYCFSTNEHAPNPSIVFPTAAFNATHSAGGRMVLYEGNWGSSYFTTDTIHGNTTHHTLWRDRFAGFANSVSQTNNHYPMLRLGKGSYYFNAVGCVFGAGWSAPGAHRYYKFTQAIWDGESSTDVGGILFPGYTSFGLPEEAKVLSTFRGYQNYDFWHAAIFDETSVAGSPTVDSSLLYTSKPSWFGDRTWPPIDPGSPNVAATAIPAGYRYVNGVDPILSSITTRGSGKLKGDGGRVK